MTLRQWMVSWYLIFSSQGKYDSAEQLCTRLQGQHQIYFPPSKNGVFVFRSFLLLLNICTNSSLIVTLWEKWYKKVLPSTHICTSDDWLFSVRLVERKKAAVKRCEEQLLKLEVQATDREENKQIALGTSKLNYLDPRISVAWWVNTTSC